MSLEEEVYEEEAEGEEIGEETEEEATRREEPLDVEDLMHMAETLELMRKALRGELSIEEYRERLYHLFSPRPAVEAEALPEVKKAKKHRRREQRKRS